MTTRLPDGVEITAPVPADGERILTHDALALVADLQREFGAQRLELLNRRSQRRDTIAAGTPMDFLPETAAVRGGDWTVAAAPADLYDRRVEITGPAERKMLINALNSGGGAILQRLDFRRDRG